MSIPESESHVSKRQPPGPICSMPCGRKGAGLEVPAAPCLTRPEARPRTWLTKSQLAKLGGVILEVSSTSIQAWPANSEPAKLWASLLEVIRAKVAKWAGQAHYQPA